MDNLRRLLGIRRMDRELFGVKKGLNERIDKGVLWWFGYVEKIAESLYRSVLVVV